MSFVTTKVCLSWQNICCDKHNFVFVVTKIIIVAAPANDNWTVLLCIITGFSFCLSSAVSPGLWTVSLHAHHDGSFPPVAFSSSDTWAFFFLFSVPSSVPTSKALLLCRLSQHQYHQPHPGLILLPDIHIMVLLPDIHIMVLLPDIHIMVLLPDIHIMVLLPDIHRRRCQIEVGCHPKETLHCCWVTLMVVSSSCSDSAYTGHYWWQY